MLNDTTSPWVHSVSPSTEARPHAMGFCSSLGPRLRMRQVSYGDVEASIPADYKTRVNVDFMKFGVSGGRPRLRPIAPIPLSPITRFCGGWQRRPHCVGGCRRFRCELQQRQILAGLVGGASPPPSPCRGLRVVHSRVCVDAEYRYGVHLPRVPQAHLQPVHHQRGWVHQHARSCLARWRRRLQQFLPHAVLAGRRGRSEAEERPANGRGCHRPMR